MADDKHFSTIELPDKWFLMTDEEIRAWRKARGHDAPTIQEVGERLGCEMAKRREEAVLHAIRNSAGDLCAASSTAAADKVDEDLQRELFAAIDEEPDEPAIVHQS